MSYSIEIKDLSLQLGKSNILKEINLSLQPGKVYGLLGRNGAGKTSFLSLLASFRLPTSGTISIDGEMPFENPRIMSEVSFSYPTDLSEESYTAADYFTDARRFRPNFDLDCAHALAKRFGFPLNKALSKLSNGQQSAFIATLGLANRTKIAIFDEVYVNMDAPTRKIFYQELIEEQARYPRLMILSTHLVSEMEYLLDHVLILDQGKLLVDQDYESIINLGVTVTGPVEEVNQFVKGRKQLNSQQLGQTKATMIFGKLANSERLIAQQNGLELSPVSLQELFIHITEEDGHFE
ncbi:ABC-2 type transport system ATP-binding protein [Amphibacillus marinus]|uniref:ABC-2 type transport system ATP-binding protein n=1 Tax=Amphibacillus marinus TaxID=872970 RepID=A0A1H8PJ11_9BACI|nr:ABC transporter ATP-binding protein [Amphibacillus marinus]SEO41796.1 ABC-2 type transport system ATP-binding protein [Amphibacillus marinus]